jgi:hypothetical protein
MSGFRWLARFFKVAPSTVAAAVPVELPVKPSVGTRFIIARVNGRLESVPVTNGRVEDAKTQGQ